MAGQSIKHILIIEDAAELLTSLKESLQTEGFSCTGVATARDATFKLKNQKYACVLLDLKLGKEKSEEIINFMRARKELPNYQTPMLIVSENVDTETMKSLAGKVQGAIVKPFDPKILCEKIKKLAH